jgi:nucleotide-binding universal stress UspA family protein
VNVENAVVVGTDASGPHLQVLYWAAAEALRHAVPLWVCHTHPWGAEGREPQPLPEVVPVRGRQPHERVVAEAVAAVRAEYPDLVVRGAVGTADPAPSLIELSRTAAMVVLGARGSGGFPGLLAGSVAAQVAAHGHCPVAVVRPPADRSGTDIVVGIDGSAGSQAALLLAADDARRSGGTLLAVHGYRLPPLLAAGSGPRTGPGAAGCRQAAEAVLEHALQAYDLAATDLKIERRVMPGSPAAALIDASTGAAAVYVGARGLGGFTGLVLGSVSQQLVRHAACPVVVTH